MRVRKLFTTFIAILMITSVLLTACSSSDTPTPEAPAATQAPAATEAPQATAEPAATEAVDVMPTAEAGEPTLTANENVRVRSGPGTQYPVYKYMVGGNTAKLLGVSADGTYYAIDIPVVSPATGWVDAQFATISNAGELPVIEAPAVPPTAGFTPVQEGQPAVVAADAVYVRSGPGQEYPAYGVAPAGSKGLVIGVSEDDLWWVVRINPEVVGKGYGWVMKEFVTDENIPTDLAVIKTPPVPTAGQLPEPDPNGPYGVATDYINVRSGPGTNYPVLIIAPPDAKGEISGKSADGQWWQVKVSTDYSASGFAWVHGAYVQAFNVENVPVVEAPPVPPTNPNPPEGAYGCLLITQFPVDGTVLKAGMAFDQSWDVQNVGEDTWSQANTSITKVGAANDQALSSVDTLSLSSDVAKGDTYQVVVSMTAPGTAGTYGEYWTITMDDQVVCYFYNVIQVQE